jgi:tetratricopeptide (TPR) repeat protein
MSGAAQRAGSLFEEGLSRLGAGDLAGAEACLGQAIELDPLRIEAHLSLGALLVERRRFQEAQALYDLSIALFPDDPRVWCDLGVLRICQEREPEAEGCLRAALAFDPGYPLARFNLGYLLLRQGRFGEGLLAMEARVWNRVLGERVQAPRWQGESLQGKALLIGPEAGYGDMIQFSRYTGLLKGLGAARLGIVCQPALKRLFATLPGIDEVIALGEPIPEPGWDFWILPQSLPLRCGTRYDAIPAPVPYLRPDPGAVQAWAARLPGPGLRVGLAWKGNPAFENDGERSLPHLDWLAPLAALPGIRFVSLQKGVAEAEARQPPAGMELFDPAPLIADFADSAALLANLDLVISVDTAVAHLAGALGRPCWVLLPRHQTDWRWFKERTDSPWYPSLRLFRQATAGDWRPVLETVATALAGFHRA